MLAAFTTRIPALGRAMYLTMITETTAEGAKIDLRIPAYVKREGLEMK